MTVPGKKLSRKLYSALWELSQRACTKASSATRDVPMCQRKRWGTRKWGTRPTVEAGIHTQWTCTWSGRWIMTPNSQDREENVGIWGREEKHELTLDALHPVLHCLKWFPVAVRAAQFLTDVKSHLASKLPHLGLHSWWPPCHLFEQSTNLLARKRLKSIQPLLY